MLLNNYSFIVIIIGITFLALSCAFVGAINLYKGQSLIGDALGHSTFPGIVLFFILFKSRDPLVLLFGAISTSFLSYLLIQLCSKYSKISLDTNLAIFLTGFFGLGMLMKSYIQGNFKQVSQSGLENYIFGQAAYMREKDVKIIVIVSILILILFFIFRKQLIIYIFDKEFASTIGINTNLVDKLILIMTISLVSVGLKAVGFILISSFLILPTVFANHISKNFKTVLLISVFMSVIASFIGTYLSSLYKGISTGPAIILSMGVFTIISITFGKYGFMGKIFSLKEKEC